MTDEEIKRLKELSEKATPGPWEAVWLGRDDHASEVHFAYEMRVCLMPSNGGERSGNDAEFIASARTAVPALLTALDEARAEAARLREALDKLVNAKALSGVRNLVAGWNGEGRTEGPYTERHPAKLGATLPKTNCGAAVAREISCATPTDHRKPAGPKNLGSLQGAVVASG